MTGKTGGINVTPMIDVLLVLIIIFMLIGPQHPVGLDAQLPRGAGGKGDAREIVASVGQDRSLKINAEPVSWDDLDARLRRIFASRAEKVLFVAGARQADFADIARVIDTARGAGIDRVALMPKR